MRTTHTRLTRFARGAVATGAAGVLALGLAACGSDGSNANPVGAATSGAGAATSAAVGAVNPSASASPLASIDNLGGGMTQVTLEAGFLQALQGFKLTPGVVGKATLNGMTLTFPITGGNVTYYPPGSRDPYVTGMIKHVGSGLSLAGGGKTVQLTDFVVDPGASMLMGKVTVDGKVAAPSAPLFFLDGRTLKPLQTMGKEAILEGTQVKLTDTAAGLLNMVYGLQNAQVKVQPTLVGVAKITVQLPSS